MPSKDKIVSLDQALEIVTAWKNEGLRTVFTNGCFDILHLGHVDYLEKASEQGDVLILGLNADASIKRLKGPERPVNNEIARARIMSCLQFIDLVVIFEEDTPNKLIEALEPQLLVKGNDYDASCEDPDNKKYIVGSDIVKKYGGQVATIALTDGYSTTSIINKIKE